MLEQDPLKRIVARAHANLNSGEIDEVEFYTILDWVQSLSKL